MSNFGKELHVTLNYLPYISTDVPHDICIVCFCLWRPCTLIISLIIIIHVIYSNSKLFWVFYTPCSVVNQHFIFNFRGMILWLSKMLRPNIFSCLASGHMVELDFLALLWLGGAVWVVLPIESWMEVTCHPDVSIYFLGQDPLPFSKEIHNTRNSGPSIILNLRRITKSISEFWRIMKNILPIYNWNVRLGNWNKPLLCQVTEALN